LIFRILHYYSNNDCLVKILLIFINIHKNYRISPSHVVVIWFGTNEILTISWAFEDFRQQLTNDNHLNVYLNRKNSSRTYCLLIFCTIGLIRHTYSTLIWLFYIYSKILLQCNLIHIKLVCGVKNLLLTLVRHILSLQLRIIWYWYISL